MGKNTCEDGKPVSRRTLEDRTARLGRHLVAMGSACCGGNEGVAPPLPVVMSPTEISRCPDCRGMHAPGAFCSAARRKSLDGQGFESRRVSMGLEAKTTYSHELTKNADVYPSQLGGNSMKSGKSTLRSPGGAIPGGATDLYAKGDIDGALGSTKKSWFTNKEAEDNLEKKNGEKNAGKEQQQARDHQSHLAFRKDQCVKGGVLRRGSLPNILKGLGQWEPKERESSNNFLAERYARQNQDKHEADVPWFKVNADYKEDGVRMSASMQAIKRRNSIAAIPMKAFKVVDRSRPWELPDDKRDTGFGGRSGRASFHS